MDKSTLIEKAKVINRAVNRYFQSRPNVTEAKPKDLMPFLITGGVFSTPYGTFFVGWMKIACCICFRSFAWTEKPRTDSGTLRLQDIIKKTRQTA